MEIVSVTDGLSEEASLEEQLDSSLNLKFLKYESTSLIKIV
jgi:hypothetical protein